MLMVAVLLLEIDFDEVKLGEVVENGIQLNGVLHTPFSTLLGALQHWPCTT